MARQIDHDAASAVSTVGLETGKGIIGGVLTAGVIGAAVLGGIGAIIGGFIPLAIAGFAIGAIGGATIGATAGGVVGVAEGIGKVGDEKAAFRAQARSNSVVPIMQAAQQQAYIAGVQDGQVAVVSKLQEMQQQQASFAERVGKKDALKPETIIAQREASTTPNLGS